MTPAIPGRSNCVEADHDHSCAENPRLAPGDTALDSQRERVTEPARPPPQRTSWLGAEGGCPPRSLQRFPPNLGRGCQHAWSAASSRPLSRCDSRPIGTGPLGSRVSKSGGDPGMCRRGHFQSTGKAALIDFSKSARASKQTIMRQHCFRRICDWALRRGLGAWSASRSHFSTAHRPSFCFAKQDSHCMAAMKPKQGTSKCLMQGCAAT